MKFHLLIAAAVLLCSMPVMADEPPNSLQSFGASLSGLKSDLAEVKADVAVVKTNTEAIRTEHGDALRTLTTSVDTLKVQFETSLEALAIAVSNATEPPKDSIPKAAVPPPAAAADSVTPTLYLFTATWCPSCPAAKASIPLLEESGEVVAEVDFDSPESLGLQSRYEVNMWPTWIRVDAEGKELDRLPAKGSDRFSTADAMRVLFRKEPPKSPPVAAKPLMQVMPRVKVSQQYVPAATRGQARRSGRGK